MIITRAQFIERATQLSLTVANPIEAIADLVESSLGQGGFQPEPIPQPKAIIVFPGEPCFKSRQLLSNGQWQRWETSTAEWVDEKPDPIQRKLAELLLSLPIIDEWEGLDDISDTELAGERGHKGDV